MNDILKFIKTTRLGQVLFLFLIFVAMIFIVHYTQKSTKEIKLVQTIPVFGDPVEQRNINLLQNRQILNNPIEQREKDIKIMSSPSLDLLPENYFNSLDLLTLTDDILKYKEPNFVDNQVVQELYWPYDNNKLVDTNEYGYDLYSLNEIQPSNIPINPPCDDNLFFD